MFDGIFGSLATQWKAIWAAFEHASALANAIQIIGFASAAASSLRWYVHWKIKDKDGQILDLKGDLADRDRKLGELRSELKNSEKLCAILESQSPQTALIKAESERRERNYKLANQI